MNPFFKASQVEATGRKGTYVTKLGGVGLAYDIADAARSCPLVVKSGGNGFYYPVEDLDTFVVDGGAGYRAAIRKLMLPPAYKA